MKSKKELEKILQLAKGDNQFYTLAEFVKDSQNFLKDVRKNKVFCSMYVSKSGMMRRFNFYKYNNLLNICYNQKNIGEAVKVGGCGMNMHWYLLFRCCEELATKKELEKYDYNSLCSRQVLI